MSPKKKRGYFAVVLIGASALVVDSLVLSSDLPESNHPSREGLLPSDASGPAPELAIPELPFPKGIKPIDPQGEIPDLFSPPTLNPKRRSEGADADKPGGVGQRLSVPGQLHSAAFEAAHRLKGILFDQRLRIAGVDGQWIRIGTSIDGCTLVTVSPREATFRCFDNEVVLTLDRNAAGVEH